MMDSTYLDDGANVGNECFSEFYNKLLNSLGLQGISIFTRPFYVSLQTTVDHSLFRTLLLQLSDRAKIFSKPFSSKRINSQDSQTARFGYSIDDSMQD